MLGRFFSYYFLVYAFYSTETRCQREMDFAIENRMHASACVCIVRMPVHYCQQKRRRRQPALLSSHIVRHTPLRDRRLRCVCPLAHRSRARARRCLLFAASIHRRRSAACSLRKTPDGTPYFTRCFQLRFAFGCVCLAVNSICILNGKIRNFVECMPNISSDKRVLRAESPL